MTPDDANDHLDHALIALRGAGEAFDRAMDGVKQTIDGIKVANHAQLEAIDAAIRALGAMWEDRP